MLLGPTSKQNSYTLQLLLGVPSKAEHSPTHHTGAAGSPIESSVFILQLLLGPFESKYLHTTVAVGAPKKAGHLLLIYFGVYYMSG